MAKYKITATYGCRITYSASVEVEAASEAEALVKVRQAEERGDIEYYPFDDESDPSTFQVVSVSPASEEEKALADLTAAYFGEG